MKQQKPKWEVVGHCPDCGAPIWCDRREAMATPPTSRPSCGCGLSRWARAFPTYPTSPTYPAQPVIITCGPNAAGGGGGVTSGHELIQGQIGCYGGGSGMDGAASRGEWRQ